MFSDNGGIQRVVHQADDDPNKDSQFKNLLEIDGFIDSIDIESMNSSHQSKKSLQTFPNDPSHAPNASSNACNEYHSRRIGYQQGHGEKSVEELDQAMKSLAESYRRRQNGGPLGLISNNGPRSRSHLTLDNSYKYRLPIMNHKPL